MALSSSDSFAKPASELPPSVANNPLAAGLPKVWWPCAWGLASLVYSVFWMTQSWRMAQPLVGPTKVNHLTQDFWCLILTLGSSYLLYQFYKRRWETLGLVLCLLVAAGAMILHRL